MELDNAVTGQANIRWASRHTLYVAGQHAVDDSSFQWSYAFPIGVGLINQGRAFSSSMWLAGLLQQQHTEIDIDMRVHDSFSETCYLQPNCMFTCLQPQLKAHYITHQSPNAGLSGGIDGPFTTSHPWCSPSPSSLPNYLVLKWISRVLE